MSAVYGGIREDFAVDRGCVTLHTRLQLPAGDSRLPCVILLHGLGSADECMQTVVLGRRLLEAGVGVTLFDLSGQGASSAGGQAGEEAYMEDLETVFHWIAARPDVDADLLGIAAYAEGGGIAMRALRHGLARPTAVALLSPVLEPCGFARVRVPTLVIAGSEDPLLDRLRTLVSWSECASLTLIAGAGPLFEEPGRLASAAALAVDWYRRQLCPGGEPPSWLDLGGGD
jgi:putative phosphoribosyl transferase